MLSILQNILHDYQTDELLCIEKINDYLYDNTVDIVIKVDALTSGLSHDKKDFLLKLITTIKLRDFVFDYDSDQSIILVNPSRVRGSTDTVRYHLTLFDELDYIGKVYLLNDKFFSNTKGVTDKFRRTILVGVNSKGDALLLRGYSRNFSIDANTGEEKSQTEYRKRMKSLDGYVDIRLVAVDANNNPIKLQQIASIDAVKRQESAELANRENTTFFVADSLSPKDIVKLRNKMKNSTKSNKGNSKKIKEFYD